jgi:hypothetical protein
MRVGLLGPCTATQCSIVLFHLTSEMCVYFRDICVLSDIYVAQIQYSVGYVVIVPYNPVQY